MYVIIAGAGVIGIQVTQLLVANKHDVVAIDRNPEICEAVYAETGALTIHGNATDLDVLEKAGAKKADVVVCLMHQAADNIACALLAQSLGVPRIIARLRNPAYEEAYRLAGATSIVRVADLLVNQIMTEVEQPKVKKITTLGGGRADIYAVNIPQKARSVGKTIREIAGDSQFPRECVLIGIYREEEDDFLIPRGDHVLKAEDTIFLVSKPQDIKGATDTLTKSR
jgi:trk system potassium uptake protein TrkA